MMDPLIVFCDIESRLNEIWDIDTSMYL